MKVVCMGWCLGTALLMSAAGQMAAVKAADSDATEGAKSVEGSKAGDGSSAASKESGGKDSDAKQPEARGWQRERGGDAGFSRWGGEFGRHRQDRKSVV